MKASEIFLKYVEPLMNEVTRDYTPEYLQKTLSFPEMVWNSIVMQKWDANKPNYIQVMRDQFSSSPGEFSKISNAMIDMWIKRKEELFPDAVWAFKIKVRQGKDGPIIRASTRMPDHLRHLAPKEWEIGNLRQIDFQA